MFLTFIFKYLGLQSFSVQAVKKKGELTEKASIRKTEFIWQWCRNMLPGATTHENTLKRDPRKAFNHQVKGYKSTGFFSHL